MCCDNCVVDCKCGVLDCGYLIKFFVFSEIENECLFLWIR